MSYCTVADVQADFKSVTFTTTSLVTTAAVTQFIVESDSLINTYIGTVWVVPITGDATSLALMSLFSRTLTVARVKSILENKQATNTDANQEVRGGGFSVKDVMKALNDIKQGDLELSGSSKLLEDAAFFSNNYSRNVQPKFVKGRRQW